MRERELLKKGHMQSEQHQHKTVGYETEEVEQGT